MAENRRMAAIVKRKKKETKREATDILGGMIADAVTNDEDM